VRRFVTFRPREDIVPPGLSVGPEWPIYNAARPIPGTVTWERKGLGVGWFFAAIAPEDRYAPQFTRRCAEFDACQVVFAAQEEAETWARAHCQAGGVDADDYPPEDFARWSREGYRTHLRHLQEDDE